MSTPFTGLSPAADTDGTRWFTDQMAGQDGVALVVPSGFAAYARLMHPLRDGDRWAEAAPEYLGRGGRYTYPFPDRVAWASWGDLGAETVDAIVPLLASATSTPSESHFGLWQGWGDMHPESRATLYSVSDHVGQVHGRWTRWRQRRQQRTQDAPAHSFLSDCAVHPWWGGRDMYLFDGPVELVDRIGSSFGDGSLMRRGPQWWWPDDRAWFVGSEIDFPWSYVGGSADLIDKLTTSAGFEAVVIDHDEQW